MTLDGSPELAKHVRHVKIKNHEHLYQDAVRIKRSTVCESL